MTYAVGLLKNNTRDSLILSRVYL